MRLIDADALMKIIRTYDYPLKSHFNSTDNGMFTIGIQQAVDEQPTIDAVEVVKCKNCKHYCPVYADTMGGRDCLLLKTITKADDYCSYGERKNED